MAEHRQAPVIAVTFSLDELSILVHWREMFAGFSAVGAIPLAMECGSAPIAITEWLRGVDGLVISGGGDIDPALYGGDAEDPTLWGVNPVRDRNEMAAVRIALDRQIPILAICRGMHLTNAMFGGQVISDLARDRPGDVVHRLGEDALLSTAHTVQLAPGSRTAAWLGVSGEVAVNSQHHQGVGTVAPGFVTTAVARDGLIEGFEHPDAALTAVQWHPEIIWRHNQSATDLLRGFAQSCGAAASAGHLPISG